VAVKKKGSKVVHLKRVVNEELTSWCGWGTDLHVKGYRENDRTVKPFIEVDAPITCKACIAWMLDSEA